jgi:hypothetical protein
MPYIDFEEVKANVTIRQVCDALQWKPSGGNAHTWYGPCPLHCSNHVGQRYLRRCCSIDLAQNRWYCHKCKKGGNQLDLFAQARKLSLYEAALVLVVSHAIASAVRNGIIPHTRKKT